MHVRLAFAVMIQVDADVLLIDEVLAVGDAAFQQKCFDQFNKLRDAGRTICLVTHDMPSVKRFCHRAMLMERGQVVAIGDPELIGERYLEQNFRRETATTRSQPAHADDDRFGDGRARFTQLWIQSPEEEPLEAAPQGKELVVKATVEFHQDVEDPSVGITILDEDRHPVFATSSVWTNEHTGVFRAGDVARLTLRFPNILSPGRYHVTPQISHRGSGNQLIDRYPRMISFIVTGTIDTGGIVALEHDLHFDRVEAMA